MYSSTVGRQADDVDRGPAEERLVVALARGGDPQLLELVVDQLVDVVGLGLVGEGERQPLGQHDELRADGVGLEPGHHERLAAVAGGDEPVGAHRGRDVVVGQEDGQAGDVAVGPVGVASPHGELLGRALAVEDGLLGIEVDAHDVGQLAGVVVGRAGFDPAVQGLVELAVGLEPLAAGVGHGARRLLEHRAVRRDGQVDPAARPSRGSSRKWSPSGSKPKSEMRKPSLPRAAPWQLPVLQPARMKTGITSSRKLSGGCTAAWATLHRHGDRLAAVGDRQASSRRRPPGRRSPRRAAATSGSARVHRRLLGDVASDPVGEGRLDDDRLPVASGRQLDLSGENLHLGQGRHFLRREDLRRQVGVHRFGRREATRPGEQQQADQTKPGDRGGSVIHCDRVLDGRDGSRPGRPR